MDKSIYFVLMSTNLDENKIILIYLLIYIYINIYVYIYIFFCIFKILLYFPSVFIFLKRNSIVYIYLKINKTTNLVLSFLCIYTMNKIQTTSKAYIIGGK